ncbi:MAG: TIGR03936 family radical SAM-associated protein, partial [Endomicrobiaceae bacterium]|nr:TIGR03936 family radical SAM-associated protein [Endomicrobiaceae bacterium]
SRNEILTVLSKLEGVYVPSFYEIKYNEDNTINEVNTLNSTAPEIIKKTIVDLDKSFFHKNKIVPFVETVHNRLNIEIARGCIGRCRFCQASKYYRPWRTRNPKIIMDLVDEGLKKTGYEDIAFSSLSCTDYKNLDTLLQETNEKYSAQNLNISLPSMRCNTFSLKVAEYINRDKKPTITFAPEAGSDRLRNVIGKYLSEKEIINTLITAYQMGWRTIKLYFMIGLPTETEDDIIAIIDLVKKIKLQAKGLNFNITIAPFAPKAHTAFQWQEMFSANYMKEVINKLKNKIPATIKAHNYRASIIEAMLARGDRKLSNVIYLAWKKGLRFDQWADRFNFDMWLECLKESNLDLDFYVYRKRSKEEILPWEHLDLGVSKEQLYNDYLNGLSETADIKEEIQERTTILPENKIQIKKTNTETNFRVLLKFSRHGDVKYISQLEQIDCLRRAVKRTNLPVAYTAGFSPQIKMSFGPAISVGYESDCEYADLYFTEKVNLDIIKCGISDKLPDGYNIEEVKQMPMKFPAVEVLVNVAEYAVKNVSVSEQQIADYLGQKEILIAKIKKGKEILVDAKPLILSIEKVEDNGLKILLRFGQNKNLKFGSILQNLLNLQEDHIKILHIERKKMCIEKNENIYEI